MESTPLKKQTYLSILIIFIILTAMLAIITRNVPAALDNFRLTVTGQQETDLDRFIMYKKTRNAIVTMVKVVNQNTYQDKVASYQKWKSAKITSYTIIGKVLAPLMNRRFSVVMSNGKLIGGLERDTIENLFNSLNLDRPEDPFDPCQRVADFDPTYGYPAHIQYYCPLSLDAFSELTIDEFYPEVIGEVF